MLELLLLVWVKLGGYNLHSIYCFIVIMIIIVVNWDPRDLLNCHLKILDFKI